MAPPGMPKTTSAPTSSRDRTSDCAPVSWSAVLCGSDIGCSSALLGPARTRDGCYACATRTPSDRSAARKKPPTARRQTRERVGSEVDSADTLAKYEGRGAKHV